MARRKTKTAKKASSKKKKTGASSSNTRKSTNVVVRTTVQNHIGGGFGGGGGGTTIVPYPSGGVGISASDLLNAWITREQGSRDLERGRRVASSEYGGGSVQDDLQAHYPRA